MPTLILLYLSFLKIGLFGFGGGYAMISLIQDELLIRGWLSPETFVDIIAIAEMTPGPIAINSATFVGFKTASFLGALLATAGIITPSFILIILLVHLFEKIKSSPYISSMMTFLRPAVISLIAAAAISFGRTSLVDLRGVLIAVGVFLVMLKTKISPIILIILAGILGIIFY